MNNFLFINFGKAVWNFYFRLRCFNCFFFAGSFLLFRFLIFFLFYFTFICHFQFILKISYWIISPLAFATLALFLLPVFSSRIICEPILVGSFVLGSRIMTLDAWIGPSFSKIPPCGFFWFGFVCLFLMLIPSTITR